MSDKKDKPQGIYPPGQDDYLYPGNYAKRAKWEKPLEPPHDRYGRVYPPPPKERKP